MNKQQDKSAHNSGQNQTLQNNAVPELSPDATPLEKKIVRQIKQCDKLIADYQKAQGLFEISTNSPAQTEPAPTRTIDDLRQAFAELCYSYGMLGRNISVERNNEALEEIITDCEALTDVSLALRLQAQGGAK